MKKKFSRRDFLKSAGVISGGMIVAVANLFRNPSAKGLSQSSLPGQFLPFVMRYEPTDEPSPPPTPPPAGNGGVVQVHANDAHNWNYNPASSYYGNHVSQSAVDRMVDAGIKNLTGETTLAAAWGSLLPNYKSGQTVAIKVSFNNGNKPNEYNYSIDSVVEPVNAIIRGLAAAGVPLKNIIIFDSQRPFRPEFLQKLTKGVVVEDYKSGRPFETGAEDIFFRPPGHSPIRGRISRVVVQADYLINVPVLKRHGFAGISMGMKNHYGTFYEAELVHDWTSISTSGPWREDYSPITELNLNPHIANKTILVVGDAIFAAPHNSGSRSTPTAWTTFSGQSPKSLFFSTDPVAIDVVMGDLLQLELGSGLVKERAFRHLKLAEDAGLGIYERGNPWTNTYKRIKFRKLEV